MKPRRLQAIEFWPSLIALTTWYLYASNRKNSTVPRTHTKPQNKLPVVDLSKLLTLYAVNDEFWLTVEKGTSENITPRPYVTKESTHSEPDIFT